MSNSSDPVAFVGACLHRSGEINEYPIKPVTIYELSNVKYHLVFPLSLKEYKFLFLFNFKALSDTPIPSLRIELIDSGGRIVAYASYQFEAYAPSPPLPPVEVTTASSFDIAFKYIPDLSPWKLLEVSFDATIDDPGRFQLVLVSQDIRLALGAVHFAYARRPPFTQEEMLAIKANMDSPKFVLARFGCKFCPSELQAYSALDRDQDMEKRGHIWQHDLPEIFQCQCGKTKLNLVYAKENLHAVLAKPPEHPNVSYERRYAHQFVMQTVNAFGKLLDNARREEVVQKFLESNAIMMSAFRPTRLRPRPKLLGQFIADFLIVDSQSVLHLIEIERPTTKLFTKKGHATAALNHAYEQVRDWIALALKHRLALLEMLSLRDDQISAIRGVVIAGRTKRENPAHLRRHLMLDSHSNISFMTFDDLGRAVALISRSLS